MALADLAVRMETISVGDASFNVYPLSLGDFASLISTEPGLLAEDNKGNVEVDVSDILSAFPHMIPKIIALASREPDYEEVAGTLPLDVQALAVAAIMRLSISDPKVFIMTMTNLLESMGTVVESVVAGVPETPTPIVGSKI